MKQSKVCRDALDNAYEINKLLRYSPKRHPPFDRIRVENLAEEDIGPRPEGIRALCPTRWTVRGDAIESIIEHYDTLSQLCDECLETWLDPDIKGRIIGVQTQMTTFDLLFGLQLSMKILKIIGVQTQMTTFDLLFGLQLKITDNLSRTLQKQSMSAAEGQSVAELTVKTLKSMRTDENFTFFALCNCFRECTNTNLPVLPRKKKAPRRFEIGTEEGSHSATVEDHYRRGYFEVLDLAIAGISDRFNQLGYAIYNNLESLLVSAANSEPFNEQLTEVVASYEDDFDSSQLSAQLQNLGKFF